MCTIVGTNLLIAVQSNLSFRPPKIALQVVGAVTHRASCDFDCVSISTQHHTTSGPGHRGEAHGRAA